MVNDKEKGGKGLPLADGEEDGEDGGDLMEEKRGRSLSVEGGNPASEHLANPMASRALFTQSMLTLS